MEAGFRSIGCVRLRLRRTRSLLGTASLFVLAAASTSGAELREESNRFPVFAARKDDSSALTYVPVRVGEERRLALGDGGRVQLALQPVQASAGGRAFLFARVPADLKETSFPAEFLVWHGGRWERQRVVEKKAGELGHMSTTVTLSDVAPGPVPTAVFRRVAAHGTLQSVVSTPIEIPKNARLKFGYSFDEWDWSDLSPVELTVTAVLPDKKEPKGREVRVFRQRIEAQGPEQTWFDAVADLSAARGEDVRLIFRAEPLYVKGRLAPHVVWSSPAIVTDKPDKDMPSVAIVVLDGVRAKSLGLYGGAPQISPKIDDLFTRDGAIFEHAVTQAVETIPGNMTLFTGVSPCAHQVFSARQTLAREIEPFAQTMAAGGYVTAAFTDAAGIAAETGFGRGFDVFYQNSGHDPRDAKGTGAAPLARAAEWVKAHADEPFAIVVHTRQARPPYLPPGEAAKATPAAFPSASVQDEKARYEREIRYLDGLVETFVEALDEASDPKRTLLVVTSSHGEEFLEHGALENGANLYEESIRVPLLVRGAGVRAKKRYSEAVGLVDLAPTILELTGFEATSRMQGGSLAEALRKGKMPKTGTRVSEARAATRKLSAGEDPRWTPPAFAASDGEHKLIQYSVAGRPAMEAYDLGSDPAEKTDLMRASRRPPWVDTLRAALDSHQSECRRAAQLPTKTETLPVSTLFKLKAFGYL